MRTQFLESLGRKAATLAGPAVMVVSVSLVLGTLVAIAADAATQDNESAASLARGHWGTQYPENLRLYRQARAASYSTLALGTPRVGANRAHISLPAPASHP
jgi:hypothetical protein